MSRQIAIGFDTPELVTLQAQVARLEHQVSVLSAALRILTHGLAAEPPGGAGAGHAVRQVEDLLAQEAKRSGPPVPRP